MEAPLYYFKVFTDSARTGNPAACALLPEWPATAVLQHLATEAQQVVTAFIVPVVGCSFRYQIRWFSSSQEINLCGHGTLAAAALLRELKGEGNYQFTSAYGDLSVITRHQSLQLALPEWHATQVQPPTIFLHCQPVDCFQTRDLVMVLADEQAVQQFQPDFSLIKQLPQHALIVTAFCAPDTYVLRYFAPAIGINEDIATGSAQSSLAPYWRSKTAVSSFKVRQLSALPASFSLSWPSEQLVLATQAVKSSSGIVC